MTRRELLAALAAALVAPQLPAIAAPAFLAPPQLIPFIELPGRIHSLTVVQDKLFVFAGDGLYEVFPDVLDRSWMRYRLISRDSFMIAGNGRIEFAWSVEDGVYYLYDKPHNGAHGAHPHQEVSFSHQQRPGDFNL